MKRMLMAVATVVLLVGVATLSAGTKAGDKTASITASVMFPEEGDTSFMMMGSFGYFVTDAFQIEVTGMGMGSEGEYGLYFQARPNFHFLTSGNVVPYVGATVGVYLFGNGDSVSDFIYGGQVGIKSFLNERTFLQLEGLYLRQSDADTGYGSITLGLGFRF